MPKGGKRAGAGAPKGNTNALKHGDRSRNWRELSRRYQKHPGRGGRRHGSGAPRKNLYAVKTGVHSEVIKQFIEDHPEKIPRGLTQEQAIRFIMSQL